MRPTPRRRSRTKFTAGIVTTVCCLLAACGSGPVEGGKDSAGKFVWYASSSPTTVAALVEGYEKTGEGTVEVFRLTTGDLISRFEQESSAGKSSASILCLSDPLWFKDQAASLRPFTDPSLTGLPEEAHLAGLDNVLAVGAEVSKVAYNTDLIKTPPKTWDDLLKPEYTGKVSVIDPGGTLTFLMWYAAVEEGLGSQLPADFVERVAKLKPVPNVSGTPLAQAVAAGELAWGTVGFGGVVSELKAKNAPIATADLYPSFLARAGCAIPKDAPNPQGAEAFLAWVMSKEGQSTYTAPSGQPAQASLVFPDLESSIPVNPDITVDYPYEELKARSAALKAVFSRMTGN